jgi:hypothetical protein
MMYLKSRFGAINIMAISAMVLLLFTGCGPRIDSLNPESGPVGSVVTVQGARFGETAAENTVKIGNIEVATSDIAVISNSQLDFKVPMDAVTGQVSITTGKGTGRSNANFIVESAGGANWTIMVYLDADNNLESAGIDDFLEMSSVGSQNGVNLVVQMDRIPGESDEYDDWTGTKRFLIGRDDLPSSNPIQDMGEQNMGNPAVLQDFIEWAVTSYPAQHYALVIWNHGNGWRIMREKMARMAAEKKIASNEVLIKAVASDDTDGDILYMREVQDALNSARQNLEARTGSGVKFDVLGFDACLMGMVEVAYAIRDNANYMVGSEETEPGDGWPYNTILTDLINNPAMTPADLARLIVVKYGNSYNSGVTQAAFDISKLQSLAWKIDTFTLTATTSWSALKSARLAAKQYHSCSYSCWGTDLWDFADEVYNSSAIQTIKAAASAVKIAVDEFVIEEYHSTNMSGSHGIAIYFPPDRSRFTADPEHSGYTDANTFMPVDYVKDHLWDNWLQDFYDNLP